MSSEPKYPPLAASRFFKNGQSARPLVEGTVVEGRADLDPRFFQGTDIFVEKTPNDLIGPSPSVPVEPPPAKINEIPYVRAIPVAVSRELLDRGRERYKMYCANCHGPQGDGDGVTVKYGFPAPPTFHSERLRAAPDGYLFAVSGDGLGKMIGYAQLASPEDRWAIVAHIRKMTEGR